MAAANRYSMVADVGGTNTRVALCEGDRLLPETVVRFRNAEHPGLETVLRTFLADNGNPDCAGAAVAVAGPVWDGKAELTNVDWSIDADTVARASGAETVAVLNDLQAQGHALGRIAPENLIEAIKGPDARPDATRLVIGVGTGFNAAPVYFRPEGRFVPPSESGHANMPIRSEAELSLCRFVESVHGFPAVEDVLSGRGLQRIYAWLGHEAGDPAEKTAKDIMDACADGSDPRAQEAVRRFVRTLGTVAGNLALIHLPFGGIYLIGGVVRAMEPYFAEAGFTQTFHDKGRFAGFMKNFGVTVIDDDFAALTGLAAHLQEL